MLWFELVQSEVQPHGGRKLCDWDLQDPSEVMLCLMRKRRIGSDVCLGGYHVSAQEVLDQGTVIRDIGPFPLTQTPDCANPRGSIAFKITYRKTRAQSSPLLNSLPQIQQIQNDISRLAPSSSALMTSPSATSGMAPSADASATALALASSLLRTSTALDKFIQAVSAISEIHPAAKLAVSLVASAYKTWKAQTTRDERVADLANTIAELWEYMTQDECLERVETLKATVSGMVSQTSECAKFIGEYTSDTKQVVRLAKNTFSDTDDIITSFEESFAKLKNNFRAGIDVAVVLVVLDVQEKLSDIQSTLGALSVDVSKLQIPDSGPPPASVTGPILTRGPPQIFHGREDFVADVTETILGADQTRIPILGAGGMGKTSVALAIANDPAIIARFGDRRHFVPCEEVSSPAPLIELIATHLGIQLPSTSPLPHVLSSLRKLHSPCLLILDNFETPWEPHETRTQIEQIVTDISCAPLLTLIITMRGRDPPAGIKWSLPSTPLNPLSLRAAKSTFLDIWSSDDWRLDDLLRSLDLLPLAITLIASVGQSGQLTPSELLLCWKEEQTKLLDLGPTDRLKSIEYTIRLSLQSPAMKSAPDAFRLLSIIAMLPSGAVLKSLPKLAPHIANLNRVVRVLISVSLAYKDDAGTLRLLSPIRSYFSHYHAPDQESLVYLRTHYYRLAEACRCQPGDKHFVRVSNGIRPEESNMESILSYYVSHAGDEDAVRAVVNYSWYLYWRDRRSRVLGVLEAATSAARRQRFSELLPRCLQQLGNILHKQGKYNEAASAYEEAVELFRLNGNEASTADCLTRLGEILRNQCRWDDSRTKLEEARNICQKTGDRLGLSWCLRSLGEIFKVQDRCDEACVMLENAQELFQELGRPLGAAQCLRSLGQVHHSQGKEE